MNSHSSLLSIHTHTHSFQSGLTALDVAKAEHRRAVCEVIEQHLNQGAKVEPQKTGGQEDSESQDQVGESGQNPKTKLTEVGNCRHMAVWCVLVHRNLVCVCAC